MRGSIAGRWRGCRHAQDRPAAARRRSQCARQVIRVTTTNRVGDREVVRVRPFVRVSANLTMTTSDLTANVPQFNRAEAAGGCRRRRRCRRGTPGAEPDAEVTFVTRDLAGVLPRVKIAAVLPARRHHRPGARYRELDRQRQQARYQLAGVRPGRANARLRGRWRRRPVCRVRGAHRAREHHAAAEDGDPGHRRQFLERARRYGQEGRHIVHDPARARRHAGGDQGDRGGAWNARPRRRPQGRPAVRILVSTVGGSQRLQPVRVIITGESAIEAVVALSDRGRYVPVDVAIMNTEVADTGDDEEDDGKGDAALPQPL